MLSNDYFKGWYFKCCADDKTVAFIPAYHRSSRITSASLQIITNKSAFNIPLDTLKFCESPLYINSENCEFSQKGIRLGIQRNNLTVTGEAEFGSLSPLRYDIMGSFRFVPFMQCRHSVYSMKHLINGQININGELFDFHDGIGYIEGDSGRSFPQKYIWTQCCFENGSIMLSVADIPLSGFHFTGIIGVVLLNGREYRLATYLGAKVKLIEKNTVIIKQGEYELCASLIEKNAFPLYAPMHGKMNRTIHESVTCKAHYKFSHNGSALCEFTSNRASFEFEYIG